MKKILFKNILSVAVSILVLSSGSLASLLHYSCKTDGKEHTQCLMDECNDMVCCESDENTNEAADSNDCCVVHPEVFYETEMFIVSVNITKFKLTADVNFSNIIDPMLLKNYSSGYHPVQKHYNYHSCNIFLFNSSLRI
ncbi:MAG TPA: hypothetical protein PK536_14100 [Ignavibacteria bacterium]|nr:hypothetical protein [Ignavibacteria bacterium]HRK00341.1 hypothetical protein [Ignavibacteria bacterium]